MIKYMPMQLRTGSSDEISLNTSNISEGNTQSFNLFKMGLHQTPFGFNPEIYKRQPIIYPGLISSERSFENCFIGFGSGSFVKIRSSKSEELNTTFSEEFTDTELILDWEQQQTVPFNIHPKTEEIIKIHIVKSERGKPNIILSDWAIEDYE
jgi:hypothetical protein